MVGGIMSDLNEYRHGLLNDICIASENNETDLTDEFFRRCCENLVEAEEIEGYNNCYFYTEATRGKKIQIDGYYHEELDDSLCLFITDLSESQDIETLTKTDISKLYKRMYNLIEYSLNDIIINYCDESDPIYDLSIDIKNDFENYSKFRFFIFTDKKITKTVRKIKEGPLHGKPVEINVWDIQRLFELETSKTGKEEIIINFENIDVCKEKGLKCVHAITSEMEGYSSYLGVIPGDVLANIYLEYGARLLEGNVRAFLSLKTGVNKGIRTTIIERPELFFAYNNGIAATATNVEYDQENFLIKSITNFQIINGGQTTASIANAVIKDKVKVNNVFVPMKLSVIKPENEDVMVPNISRYANMQNKVDEADFFSNKPYNVRMEEFSRRIMAPAVDGNQYGTYWFFERARGQYTQAQMKMTDSQRKTFEMKNPKKQILKKTDIAKYWNSYYQKPTIVSQGNVVNTRKFAEYICGKDGKSGKWKSDNENLWCNEQYYKKTICLAILFKSLEQIVSQSEWYKIVKSYRANVVTYTIALLFKYIEDLGGNYELDFNRIWNNQALYNELVDVLQEISEKMYYSLVREDRTTANPTQWAKREGCWKHALEIKYSFPVDFIETLVVKNIDLERDYKKAQKLVNEINYEVFVINKDASIWKRLIEFAVKHKIIKTQKELDILTVAYKISSTGKLPTAKQSKIIYDIYKKCEQLGFE